MMAFFLLMWLLAMVAPAKRAAIADYFKHFSIFEQSGKSFMKESSEIFSKPGNEVKSVSQEGHGPGELNAEEFKNRLKKAIDEKLQALKEHLMVDTVEGGVRIQLVDTEGKPMFLPGGAEPTQFAKQILSFVSDNIKGMPNMIAIEGHTDSSPLKRQKYTNWELSIERASAARRALEENAIDPDRIARVVGYADTQLLYKDNPTDSRNRRISIILLQEKVKETPKPKPVENVETKPVETPQPLQTVQPPVVQPSPKPATRTPAPTRQEQNKPLIVPIPPKNPLELTKPVNIN